LGILYIDKGIGTHTPYIEQEEDEEEKRKVRNEKRKRRLPTPIYERKGY